MQIHEWVREFHPAWLAPKPKGFIPELSDCYALMWIERRLKSPRLAERLRRELTSLRKKALEGKLTDAEFRKLREQGSGQAASLRSLLSALRAARRQAARVPGVTPDMVADLDRLVARIAALLDTAKRVTVLSEFRRRRARACRGPRKSMRMDFRRDRGLRERHRHGERRRKMPLTRPGSSASRHAALRCPDDGQQSRSDRWPRSSRPIRGGDRPQIARARATKSGSPAVSRGAAGTSRATTRLRRVISTTSPRLTERRTFGRSCWASRTVAVRMCVIMTHIKASPQILRARASLSYSDARRVTLFSGFRDWGRSARTCPTRSG